MKPSQSVRHLGTTFQACSLQIWLLELPEMPLKRTPSVELTINTYFGLGGKSVLLGGSQMNFLKRYIMTCSDQFGTGQGNIEQPA